MSENRLIIIHPPADETGPFPSDGKVPRGPTGDKMFEMRAKFERLWLTDPESFNPLRNCMERERLERTWGLMVKHASLCGQKAVDIGCAAGNMSRRLRDAGALVVAVDIAENALKRFVEAGNEGIALRQETMPSTGLESGVYRLVICTELIADLPQEDYRLFFAELSRLIHPDGFLVCSTPIDIDSEGGVEKLTNLARAEFDILDDFASYHALHLRCRRFFEAPSRFVKGRQEAGFKRKEMASLKGFGSWWFQLNTTFPLIWLWLLIKPLAQPICNALKNNRKLLLFLEKTCRFFYDQGGISHYLFIAKRRAIPTTDPLDIPIEKPRRKEVWD